MKKAIFTRYRGPTKCRGAKIVAKASDNAARSSPFDYSFSNNRQHCLAALEYAKHMNWHGFYVAGELPDGTAYVCMAVDGYCGNYAEHLADMVRVSDAYGTEGEDWFYLAIPGNGVTSTEIVPTD